MKGELFRKAAAVQVCTEAKQRGTLELTQTSLNALFPFRCSHRICSQFPRPGSKNTAGQIR